MPALNRVQFIGRLGKDPETKTTPTAKRSAISAWRSAAAGNPPRDRESTEWMNIEAWGRLGEVCQQYLHKGSLIFVEGRLQTDKYEDKSGETQYFTKVVAISMQMLDKKPEEEPEQEIAEDGRYEKRKEMKKGLSEYGQPFGFKFPYFNPFQLVHHLGDHVEAALPEGCAADVDAGLGQDLRRGFGAACRQDLQIRGLKASPSALNCW